MKGKFIVFEGIDGSGKGTIIARARELLIKNGVPEERIFLAAEPTNSLHGRKVRELLKSSVNPQVNAKQFLDLYVEDRKEHLEKEILPALQEGKIILCDRYKYSTFVYQALQGIPAAQIKKLHEGMAVPDLVFILDLPASAALKRISADPKRKQLEAFEKKAFLEKVSKQFAGIKKIFPDEKIVVVDASKDIETVLAQIAPFLKKII